MGPQKTASFRAFSERKRHRRLPHSQGTWGPWQLHRLISIANPSAGLADPIPTSSQLTQSVHQPPAARRDSLQPPCVRLVHCMTPLLASLPGYGESSPRHGHRKAPQSFWKAASTATSVCASSPGMGNYTAPLKVTAALSEIFRYHGRAMFPGKAQFDPDFAPKIHIWQCSRFSIESGIRILDQPTCEETSYYQ